MKGNCAENIANVMKISREEQDEYGISSYKKSQAAAKEGIFKKEIVPVTIKKKKGRKGLKGNLNEHIFIFGVQFHMLFLLMTRKTHFVAGDVVVSEDEEYNKVNFDKFKSLRTVFQKDGKP